MTIEITADQSNGLLASKVRGLEKLLYLPGEGGGFFFFSFADPLSLTDSRSRPALPHLCPACHIGTKALLALYSVHHLLSVQVGLDRAAIPIAVTHYRFLPLAVE